MAWALEWWTFLVAAIVLFVPGIVAGRSLGLRRLGLWAFAPVASTAMVVLLALLYPLAGVAWNGLTAGIGLLSLSALCVVAARALRIPASNPPLRDRRGPLLLGLIGGAILGAVRVMGYIGAPDGVSQSNDAPFHLGAVRAIIEQAVATPFGLGGLVDPQAPGAFYPGAWHAVASLIATYSGSGIPQTTNVLTVMVAVVVWTSGVAWLTQAATGRRLAAAAAAALSPVLVAFPLLLIQYGILYSYLFAVALVPAAVAVVIELVRTADAEPARLGRRVGLVVAVGMALLALAMAQTSVILTWALLVALFAAGRLWVNWGDLSPRRRWVSSSAVIAGFMALALVWWRMSLLVTADYWGSVRTPGGAAIDLLSSGYAGTPMAWAVSALAAVGAVAVLVRRRTSWLAVAWLALAFLYAVAAAVDTAVFRLPLVGPWYGDTYRLAALLPILTLPLAAVGVATLADVLVRVVGAERTAERVTGWVAVGTVLALLAGSVIAEPVVQRYHVANGVTETQSRFTIDDETWLTLDERTLLERLPATVEAGARVIGNPGTGAAFGFALSGVNVFPAKWQVPRGTAYAVLAEGLRDAASDPEVCAAVDELGVGYVLDFGPGDPGTGHVEMPGFTGFDGQPGFERVDSEGAASLWRVSACGR